MKSQIRRRTSRSAGVVLVDRAVSEADFSIKLPDGEYLFQVNTIDDEYKGDLVVLVGGELAAPPVTYAKGEPVSLPVLVKSDHGTANITFVGGRDGHANSMISSLSITPAAAADPDKLTAAREQLLSLREKKKRREETRASSRASYRPVDLIDQFAPRQEVDLTGNWLFLPAQEVKKGSTPFSPLSDDNYWHTLAVPQFWQPAEWWLYTKNGASANYMEKEKARCDSFTFDYHTTDAGWYRQWIDIPRSLQGKKFVLKFDAVASVAEVYWNGNRVGSHIGMFGPFECDVTPYVTSGSRNLLTVFVAESRVSKGEAEKESAAVAASVQVTTNLLNSLPRGWFGAQLGGIWQPVKLEVTGRERIADVFFNPSLDGASIETTIEGTGSKTLRIRHFVSELQSGVFVFQELQGWPVQKQKSAVDRRNIKVRTPKLWSPEHPNLYVLTTQLIDQGEVVDQKETVVGFRTFEVRGNRLYLNGRPYFLRGSNMPPHGLAPNDQVLADKFMRFMHDGNQMVTRFHVCPPPKVWLDAADRIGVASTSDGTWPWVLLGDTPIPDRGLLALWKSEFLDIVRANRNHPSLLIWALSNETDLGSDPLPSRRLEKYRIFSDVIKAVRDTDPTKPVIFSSGYSRNSFYYEKYLKPNGLDDGDIDDGHYYFGWYDKSPFHLNVGALENGHGSRPLISQEASTGYTDNDTGYPVERYLKELNVPQAWVGRFASPPNPPDDFLYINALITKEYAEKIRRERRFISGWGLFASTSWFKDVYDPSRITPYPVYSAVQKAWQPVLVSVASADRHFEAGETFDSDVYVLNDDPDHPNLTDLVLEWRVKDEPDGEVTSGTLPVPDCQYDGKSKVRVSFVMPSRLLAAVADGTLSLRLLQGQKVISQNDYRLVLSRRDYYTALHDNLIVLEKDNRTSAYLQKVGFKCQSVREINWGNVKPASSIVIAAGVNSSQLGDVRSFQRLLKSGLRVLMIGPAALEGKSDEFQDDRISVIPDLSRDEVMVAEAEGDFVDVLVPELLEGMDPMDMHWWNALARDVVRVCRTSFIAADGYGVTKLATHTNPHGYLKPDEIEAATSSPVVEIKRGKGKVLLSSLLLAEDPLAKKFTSNLIKYLLKSLPNVPS